jgi:hypothetical protein
MVICVVTIHWMVGDDALAMAQASLMDESLLWWRYVPSLLVLYFSLFPLVSTPITLLLGSQMFFVQVGLREHLRQLVRLAPKLLLILGLLRLGLVPLLLELLADPTENFSAPEAWAIFAVFPLTLLVRSFHPFAPEVLSLELCPLRKGKQQALSYRSRMQRLHGPMSGELFVRSIITFFVAAWLLAALVGTGLFVQATLTGLWNWTSILYYLVLPTAIWLTGLFVTIFRYLSYIDCRIRLECWELDLSLRAESLRLKEKLNPKVKTGGETSLVSELTVNGVQEA